MCEQPLYIKTGLHTIIQTIRFKKSLNCYIFMNTKIYFFLALFAIMFQAKAQDQSTEIDRVAFGIGLGFDYGGIGGNILVYPHKNVGLFFGGGYALAGFGYNTGVKLRFGTQSPSKLHPYLIGMYGYNAAVAVANTALYDKLFYGSSFGLGIDHYSRRGDKYLSFALLVPVRGPEAENYINSLQKSGVHFSNSLVPIALSIGYHFVIAK